MKTSLFIANVVSAILLLNILAENPSITGFAVADPKTAFTLASPLGFSVIFIIIILALDIYFYMKGRKEL